MIAYIKGVITQINIDSLLIENNNVGYEVFFARPENVSLNQEIKLFTYHKVSEDEESLYGFMTESQLKFFKQLLSVKGIGAKSAMNIFSKVNIENLIEAISNNDVDFLQSISGIGAKSAAQIILDLSGKLSVGKDIENSLTLSSLFDSLKSLGYKNNEINTIIQKLSDINEKSESEILKEALQLLAKNRG